MLADNFSLEFEWQQVSSSLQDSSQYSGRSQYCCSLNSLHPSRYFQVLQSLYQSFSNCTKSTNWYNRQFHVPQYFQFPCKVEVLIPLFTFFQFHSVVRRDSKAHNSASSLLLLLLLLIIRSGRLAEIRWSVCISKSHRSLCVSFSWTDSRLCDVTHSAPTLNQLLRTISLYGRWSTCGSDRDIAHFFTATRITIDGVGGKRTNEQNEQYAWG